MHTTYCLESFRGRTRQAHRVVKPPWWSRIFWWATSSEVSRRSKASCMDTRQRHWAVVINHYAKSDGWTTWYKNIMTGKETHAGWILLKGNRSVSLTWVVLIWREAWNSFWFMNFMHPKTAHRAANLDFSPQFTPSATIIRQLLVLAHMAKESAMGSPAKRSEEIIASGVTSLKLTKQTLQTIITQPKWGNVMKSETTQGEEKE